MYRIIILTILLIFTSCSVAQYQPFNHRKITGKEIDVRSPGGNSGYGNINVLANDIARSDINNYRFDVEMPFHIQRHGGLCAVILRGKNAAEVANSAFHRGQGCLSVRERNSL